jgi:hypothetical protein
MVLQRDIIKLGLLFAFILTRCQVFAGVQIITSDITRGGMISSTNLVVWKIETNTTRMDIGSAFSVISLPAASGQMQLFHQTKTYQWQMANEIPWDTNPPALLPAPMETTFDGFPAQLYCFTNGLEYAHIWVASSARFFKFPTNGFTRVLSSPDLSKRPRPGTPLDTNSIIVGTEYSSVASATVYGGAGNGSSQPQFTNLVVTQTSKLISIIQTNFAASDFALPTNYVEGKEMPPTAFQTDPAKLGLRPAGPGNFTNLRKQYESGAPVLAPIHFGP